MMSKTIKEEITLSCFKRQEGSLFNVFTALSRTKK